MVEVLEDFSATSLIKPVINFNGIRQTGYMDAPKGKYKATLEDILLKEMRLKEEKKEEKLS